MTAVTSETATADDSTMIDCLVGALVLGYQLAVMIVVCTIVICIPFRIAVRIGAEGVPGAGCGGDGAWVRTTRTAGTSVSHQVAAGVGLVARMIAECMAPVTR